MRHTSPFGYTFGWNMPGKNFAFGGTSGSSGGRGATQCMDNYIIFIINKTDKLKLSIAIFFSKK